jgi:nucleoside-triphosphatase THEP1
MIYRVSNNHFYPVQNKKKILSVAMTTSLMKQTESELIIKDFRKNVEASDDIDDIDNVVFCESVYDELAKRINDDLVIPDRFHLKGGQLFSFRYGRTNYVSNDDIDVIKKMCENMNKKYTGQGVGTCILDIWKEVSGFEKVPKSSHNPYVIETLLKAKSNRSHYGFVDLCNDDMNKCVAYDIVKCYRACMYKPTEDWLRLDFNDEWEKFDGQLKNGLYYVRTNDTMLFKKSNIYSTCIIKKAIQENIKFKIEYQLIPSHYETRDLFVKFIDKVVEYSKGDECIAKLLINMLSGLLGQTHREAVKCKINSDTDQIFDWLHRYAKLGKGVFIKQVPETDKFLYGFKREYIMNETNLPMYIQVLDESNVRLYDMAKKVGGQLVARKVDCVVVRQRNVIQQLHIKEVYEWGDFRPCSLPVINCCETCEHKEMVNDNEWTDHNINDSDDYEKIYNLLQTKGGLLLQGNAGNGKTYVAKKISERVAGRVKILAPTNKAALNIGGSTIHSFLKMTEDCKINMRLLKLINEKYDYIIIDEISMITKQLWKILCILKKETDIKFILLGDDKQCPPVEKEAIDNYFNHSALKYLTHNNRNILTIRKRYDAELYDMLKDVDNIDTAKFPLRDTERNICYFNTTRKLVNKQWNERLNTDNSLFIPVNADDNYTQDTYLYEGLPVIARKSKKEDNQLKFVNSETFTVSHYDDKYVYIWNERPDDDGNKTIYCTEVEIGEFNKYFAMNYCSTTHKSQGETITENYTIYNWEYMSTKIRYTSLSRAKTVNQVSFREVNDAHIVDVLSDFEDAIEKKIKGHLQYDQEKGLNTNITVEDVVTLFERQNGECIKCECQMKTKYPQGDDEQFSIDRIDSCLGHIKGNIQLMCLKCNRAKKNRYLI